MTTSTSPAAKSRAIEFRKRLQEKALVADGAMGTMLYSRGVFINRCYDELNVSAPAMVKEIHEQYVKAGAEVLETNTFGANRMRQMFPPSQKPFITSVRPVAAPPVPVNVAVTDGPFT